MSSFEDAQLQSPIRSGPDAHRWNEAIPLAELCGTCDGKDAPRDDCAECGGTGRTRPVKAPTAKAPPAAPANFDWQQAAIQLRDERNAAREDVRRLTIEAREAGKALEWIEAQARFAIENESGQVQPFLFASPLLERIDQARQNVSRETRGPTWTSTFVPDSALRERRSLAEIYDEWLGDRG